MRLLLLVLYVLLSLPLSAQQTRIALLKYRGGGDFAEPCQVL